jgi:hypothetical protein
VETPCVTALGRGGALPLCGASALVKGHPQRVEDERRARVRCAMSATQSRFGASALKSRSTRSGRRRASGSGWIVHHGLPRRFRAADPVLAHQLLDAAAADTARPRVSAFHIRRDRRRSSSPRGSPRWSLAASRLRDPNQNIN